MDAIINFDFERDSKEISDWWNNLCQYLRDTGIGYDNSYDAFNLLCKNDDFFKMFTNTLVAGEKSMVRTAKEIGLLSRFIREPNLADVTAERFIPKICYAKLNRMNDYDRVYNYFVTSLTNLPRNQIIRTGVKELRAKLDDTIWMCDFNIPDSLGSEKIIDFTSEYRLPTNISEFNALVYRKYKQAIFAQRHSEGEAVVQYYIIQLVKRTIEESDVFAPIDKSQTDEEQREKYKPFHFICNYYQEKGYIGLLFRSTLNPCATNLVLFDPKTAECDFSSCNKVDIEPYI